MAILFKKGVEIGPITLIKDNEGKILSLFFIFEKQIFQIINLCAPTNPSLRNKFYKNYLKQTNNSSNQNLILAGDFNMVEDLFLDRQGGAPCNSHIIGLTDLQKIKQKQTYKIHGIKRSTTKEYLLIITLTILYKVE